MNRRNSELFAALFAIILITGIYFLFYWLAGSFWKAGSLGGHLFGVIGFTLMLATEIMYSVRKKAKKAANWGRMESWFKFHIFTGLVGPYMVLLHTSWHFNGLAGMVTLLTLVIVISGFIGRYLYSAIPRTADGLEISNVDLDEKGESALSKINDWLTDHQELTKSVPRALFGGLPIQDNIVFFWRRLISEYTYGKEWKKTREQLKNLEGNEQIKVLEHLLKRQREIQYQKAYFVRARRLLSVWHAVHIPIGMALFTLAFIHIGAALYYVTLAR